MSKLSAGRFRFGSVGAASVVLAWSVPGQGADAAQASEDLPQISADAPAWLERSREILEAASQSEATSWLRSELPRDLLEAAADLAGKGAQQVLPAGPDTPAVDRVLIFASFSVPPATFRNLLAQAAEPNVMLVLRGLPAGADVRKTLLRLKALLSDDESVPNVLIDPTLYRRYRIERVPTFVLDRGATRTPIIATGAITLESFRRMASTVHAGGEHLGRRAETYAIAERDLILEMQERLARIDWGARKQAAIDGFWKSSRGTFVDLPDARESRAFIVDPTVRVTEDIEDAEGQRLVSAGETFNPLDWVRLTKTLIVFRGTDPEHVAIAAHVARAARQAGRPVTLLTTRVDVERGWSHLSQLERDLAGAVYVLPASLAERFQLAHVPATVVSQGRHLLVTELPVKGAP
jgi:conjugal transfer pilus assembly protein TraW